MTEIEYIEYIHKLSGVSTSYSTVLFIFISRIQQNQDLLVSRMHLVRLHWGVNEYRYKYVMYLVKPEGGGLKVGNLEGCALQGYIDLAEASMYISVSYIGEISPSEPGCGYLDTKYSIYA